MYDVIIIGKGPAAISAALYIKRSNLSLLIIGKDIGTLEKAEIVENYYGIKATGKEIFEAGIKQAKELEIPINSEEVLEISYNDTFIITTNKEKYEAKTVLLATGKNRITPKIEGIKEFEGKGISYCALCDGFLYKGQNVAVLGNGEYALHEAQELSKLAKTVTILTNGNVKTKLLELQQQSNDNKIKINTNKIEKVEGDTLIRKIKFTDNTEITIKGLFIAEGVATSTDFAKKLGVQTKQNNIVVNNKMETNIPGLYAAGDCIGGLMQISTAVAEGAIAGTEIIKYLREK